ncbi:Nucleotidyltransferase domain-containing protein [Pseudovibrio denitrificans]|uniref:Nucleotidyltransferase domain-containing protein n=2 Tax=Pseudovibrio denitrificans TaxID=258256 RepID=A0A1I7C4B7_9HYPH|nr:Nucleotidyltransferase domain-containing protein [Pseudovibrio denitrificans]
MHIKLDQLRESMEATASHLKPIGRLSWADEHGVLPHIGRAPEEPLFSELSQFAEKLKLELGERFHCLAVRGSASRGTFVKGASDIDLIVFTRGPALQTLSPEHWITQAIDIDLEWFEPKDFLQSSRFQWLKFSLSYSGYCFGPQNLLAELPAPTLGSHAIAHLHRVDRWAKAWPTHLADAKTDGERKRVCSWLMKRIVRSLFEAEMLRRNAYSRDIYPCAKIASEAFLFLAPMIWRAAELAVAPTSELSLIREVADCLLPELLNLQSRLR